MAKDDEKKRAKGGPVNLHKKRAMGDEEATGLKKGGKVKEKKRAKGGRVGGLLPNKTAVPKKGASCY